MEHQRAPTPPWPLVRATVFLWSLPAGQGASPDGVLPRYLDSRRVPPGILLHPVLECRSLGGVVRRRRVLAWGALSHRELLNTARARARQPSNVLAESGWWVGAQELRAQQLHRDGGVPAEGDPYRVLTGAVATQVVALDLCAQQQPSTVARGCGWVRWPRLPTRRPPPT